jgi:hypothetical protein
VIARSMRTLAEAALAAEDLAGAFAAGQQLSLTEAFPSFLALTQLVSEGWAGA